MMADDFGGGEVKDKAWAVKENERQVLGMINDMINRIDQWTDVFTIKRKSKDGKEIWVEQITSSNSRNKIMFTKSHLRQWTILDELLEYFCKPGSIGREDLEGKHWRIISQSAIEYLTPTNGMLQKIADYKQDWARKSNVAKEERAVYELLGDIDVFKATHPPRNIW